MIAKIWFELKKIHTSERNTMSGKYEDYHGKRYHGRRRNAQDYGHYRRDDDSNR